jgi:hypothetical protein
MPTCPRCEAHPGTAAAKLCGSPADGFNWQVRGRDCLGILGMNHLRLSAEFESEAPLGRVKEMISCPEI